LTDRAGRIGVLLAAIGAMSYGITVVVGEDLADAGFGPATSLGVRFGIAGVLLAIVVRARRVALFPSRRVVLTGLSLGVAYAIEATFFFSALERGTAAAAALVFYVYPAMVTLVELLRGRERPHRVTFVALGLSMCGTAIVVAGGGRVSVTPAGVAFALAAAATFSAYLLVGREYSKTVDPMVVACWVSIGASVSNIAWGGVTRHLVDPWSRLDEIGLYGLSTAIAFTLTFAAMNRIGAARVAVVMTLEAVSAVVMAALFLGESVSVTQAIGGVAVLAAAVVIARSQGTTIEPFAPVGG
jgi:drug/metabolite transporter (DMT)-like permease